MVKRTIEVAIIGKDKLSSAMDSITKGALRRIGEELTMFARRLPAAAVEMVKLGATAERQSIALNNLAASFGQSGDEIISAIQRASDMTIDRMAAMQTANKAMLLGVAKTPEEFERLTKVAVRLGRAMGQDAVKSIDDFVVAAGRQSIMIADNLGLMIKQGDLQDDVNRIMKETPGITEAAAKSQAFLNSMLESGEKKMEDLGTSGSDTATDIEGLTRALKDLKTTAAELAAEVAKPTIGALSLGAQAASLTLQLDKLQNQMIELGVITKEDAVAFNNAEAEMRRQARTSEDMAARVISLNQELERLQTIQSDRKAAHDWINAMERGIGVLEDASDRIRETSRLMGAMPLILKDFSGGVEDLTHKVDASIPSLLNFANTMEPVRTEWIAFTTAVGDEDPFAASKTIMELAAESARELETALANAEEETRRLGDETARLAEEAEAAAAITGDEFVAAVGDAEDGTVNWAIALLEAADAAGADANELAILAGSLGIYTDEQIAAALATVALTATIDTLGQAIADGSITIDEAIATVQEAVDALKIDINLTQRSTAVTGRSTAATRQNTKAKRDATRAARELAREQARSGDLFIDALDNMELATEAADAWAVKLLGAADAAGADATELALLAGALGLYTDEQLKAALAMAAMEVAIADLGAKIAAGMKMDKAIREFNRLRDALQLPDWMQPGSPTPLELGLLGIADAMRQVSAVELPRLQSSLAGAGAPGGNRMVTNNFMLTTNTQAPASMVMQDFQTMQAMAG